MGSVADYQARAKARAAQQTPIIPEFTMDDGPGPSENEGNGGSDNESTGDGAGLVRRADIQHGGLTVDEVTRLVRHHNLPGGFVSEVQNFQRVFIEHISRFDAN